MTRFTARAVLAIHRAIGAPGPFAEYHHPRRLALADRVAWRVTRTFFPRFCRLAAMRLGRPVGPSDAVPLLVGLAVAGRRFMSP
jgi:hypothetical protein